MARIQPGVGFSRIRGPLRQDLTKFDQGLVDTD
jgi:hypothetical protein